MYFESCNEEIVLKVTQEQSQELANFYSQIEQRAYRMAMIETRNSSDALDMVQDAMESLMKRYAHHSSQEWKPLFYKILQNRIKDWHRWSGLRAKLHLHKSSEEDAAQEELLIATNDPTPIEQSELDFTIDKLQVALKQLSFRQRQTVLLRIWEGFNVEETAKIMKCSQGSVKTHLSRALSALKALLSESI